MAIQNFIQQKKKQQYLIYALAAFLLIIIGYLGYNFLGKKKPVEEITGVQEAILPPKKIEINFGVLKNPLIDQLQMYQEIQPFEGQIGRDNPISHY